MGNAPAKESRSRSHSQASTTSMISNLLPTILSSLGAGRSRARSYSGAFSVNTNNTNSAGLLGILGGSNSIGSAGGDKKKRQEEKVKQKELHYQDLVVRYYENVDGGYLAPYGTYKSNLDFNTEIVRNLVIARRLAPFYTPLQDFDPSWSDNELVVLLSQLTLHLIETAYSEDEDEDDDIDSRKLHKSANYYRRQEQRTKLKQIIAVAKETQKHEEQVFLEDKLKLKSTQSQDQSQILDLPSRDLLLALYRNASECPICFLYFPQHFNISRCCHQPICSECFVQIKRLDPHPPHDDPSQTSSNPNETPHTLISEPANCPFCAMPDFGVTYTSPSHISTGIEGMTKPGLFKSFANIPEDDSVIMDVSPSSPATGSSSLSPQRRSRMSGSSPVGGGYPARRRSSLAASDPAVVTIDMIRPDWEQKLISARNRLARKAATATAIHASNLLIDDNNSGRSSQAGSVLLRTMEDRMVEEALRLSLLDEEERRRKAQEDT
ncbi:SNF1-interacting protein [Scheffersomyces spartinae]|uniref:SNF1-interacting protein n=1 Tax=Scheffersomyces spartinae TaxID=45513 RepID=A0A9P8AGH8_9ASCO|nr:SNF1-interacting protein [Scheffersomyces spartinae]KAG7192370.1 SNF1-interacting protein [Scheffersomyces spartinae]